MNDTEEISSRTTVIKNCETGQPHHFFTQKEIPLRRSPLFISHSLMKYPYLSSFSAAYTVTSLFR